MFVGRSWDVVRRERSQLRMLLMGYHGVGTLNLVSQQLYHTWRSHATTKSCFWNG